jgi:RND family efflux transporter MFP subunit
MRRPHGVRASVAALLVVGVLPALATLSGCGGRRGEAEPGLSDSAAVLLGASDVAVAARIDLASGVPVTGTLHPMVEIRITSPMPELLEAVLVREGQAVRKGQVLARFRASALGPSAASADARFRAAKSDFERMENLYGEGAASKRDVENAEAAMQAADAERAWAAKRLDEATVRAPADGVIGTRLVETGDRAGDGELLFTLVNTSELEFEATAASEFVHLLRPGAPVALTVSGFPAGSIAGAIARVNATADPATRQVKIYATVPNRDGRLVGDLFASGLVLTGETKGTIAIPPAGVKTDAAGRTYVWIVEGGRIARRDVTTGLHDEAKDRVGIGSGLAGGETVIVGPIRGLAAGQAVRVAGAEG